VKPPAEPVCKQPAVLPEPIANRAALDRIAYRIADYASARRWLLEQLDRSQPLAAWTYRGSDDPGIALYEGAGLLIDSLTFYQEAYANEAYLRTATWRESVADLVRLLGYRLKPGIGGTGTVGFEVKGDKPVTIPSGIAVQAKLAPNPQTADFETSDQVVALPWLSKLTLNRPQIPLWILDGATKLVVAPGKPLTFAKNDRIAIGTPKPGMTGLATFEIAIVDAVDTWHDRTVLTLKGPITKVGGFHPTLTAVKLDKTFHFTGHNAPSNYVTVDASGTPTGHDVSFSTYTGETALTLDPQATDLALGSLLAIQLVTPARWQRVGSFFVRIPPQAHFELGRVVDARSQTVVYGPMSVPSTIATLQQGLAAELGTGIAFDIRTVQVDTVVGAPFTVGPVWFNLPGPKSQLVWWGDAAQAHDLIGRRIGIAPAGKPSFVAKVLAVDAHGDHSTLSLDTEVDLADFNDGNTTAVYGNLVDVTQGKRADQAVLGNGDDRATFQSFQLPKNPLTYLERAALTPPEQPEIEIVVSGRIWTCVPVLFGQAPDAEVYIVRQDDAGNSWVQFGDGKTGSRLPSGLANVIARYRTGAGAYGPLADGAKATADHTIKQITAADLVGVVVGGSAPEDATTAKFAAPARVQSLDRIVSITDVEAEALAIGGVARARAVWTISGGVPVVQVTLLMQPGRAADLANARSVLATANRMRGPQRFPIVVVPGAFEYVYLDLAIAIDPSYDPQPVRDAVTAALGVSGMAGIDGTRGLFGERSSRTFGDAEYATRIEGVAQNVAGVQWALVNALGSLGVADVPSTLAYPAFATRAETVPCAGTHVLRLYAAGDGGPLILRSVRGDR
jgi:hypothetical protein